MFYNRHQKTYHFLTVCTIKTPLFNLCWFLFISNSYSDISETRQVYLVKQNKIGTPYSHLDFKWRRVHFFFILFLIFLWLWFLGIIVCLILIHFYYEEVTKLSPIVILYWLYNFHIVRICSFAAGPLPLKY